jgi:hypothetical protein
MQTPAEGRRRRLDDPFEAVAGNNGCELVEMRSAAEVYGGPDAADVGQVFPCRDVARKFAERMTDAAFDMACPGERRTFRRLRRQPLTAPMQIYEVVAGPETNSIDEQNIMLARVHLNAKDAVRSTHEFDYFFAAP